MIIMFFFVKQKTAYDMRISDWSSDVCSSDLPPSYFFDGMPIDGAAQDTGDPLAAVAGDIAATSDNSPISRRQALELVRYFSAIRDRNVREAIFKMVRTCSDVTDEAETEGGAA